MIRFEPQCNTITWLHGAISLMQYWMLALKATLKLLILKIVGTVEEHKLILHYTSVS